MDLGIYGSGGLGREVYDCAMRRNSATRVWSDVFFIDDYMPEEDYYGTVRMRLSNALSRMGPLECVVAVGEPSARAEIFIKLAANDVSLATLIDPSAIISPISRVGRGSIVMEFVTLKANVSIGENVLVQPFCDIGHDINVGDHSVLGPFFAPGGGTTIGDRVFIGLKVCCLEGLTIENDAIVGMGSSVFKNVPAGATVVGNPARITKGNEEGKVFRP